MALAGLAILAGCGEPGPKKYDVSGTVQYEGEPVTEGDIMFASEDKTIGPEGGKIKDGKYALKVREGKNRVEIRGTKIIPGKKGSMGEPFVDSFIPEKYNTKTELTADVGSGKTTHNFELKK
ncbi:hypothetical protein FRUB_07296 [Fimbriiglobus ruber]|uniref:Uncharacterized protein n=1 Tax=Fimbriiglobus ruber TaxID=1908690 RepID=A0A225DL34_9BACT|nr:hypothetical protein FRUB_07296 [Fimbriiglobus ruber]